MKLKRNYKKCLSTAILLCLMASSAYAMPTGGNVVMGNVTNVNNPAAIMAANAHSIIDWNKFNIAANEKVIFNTNTFTVLNRVQGGYESQILGVLQDQGKGHLILMNTSGIVLGENSVIDANKLTLSTLEISNDEFNNLVNGRTANFKTEQPNDIYIKNNAKITVKEALNLYGGKISIADGVEIVSKEYGKVGVNMFATDHVKIGSNSANEVWYLEGGSVSVGDAQIGSDVAAVANLDVRAEHTEINGTDVVVDNQSSHKKKVILLNGSDIEVKNATLENRNGDIDVVASDGWRAAVTWDTFTAYPSVSNKATVKNTSFKTSGNDVAILGANVDVYGSNIISGKNLIVGAVKEYSNVEGITTATTYDTSTVNVDDNTQIDVAGTSTVYGAIVNVDWKKFDQTVATTNPLVMWQGRNDISNEEIIEQAKKLKDKEEMQRIINMLQDAGGTVLPETTGVIAKPVVPSYEDTKNKGDVVVLTGEVTQEYIEYLKKKAAMEEKETLDGAAEVNVKKPIVQEEIALEPDEDYRRVKNNLIGNLMIKIRDAIERQEEKKAENENAAFKELKSYINTNGVEFDDKVYEAFLKPIQEKLQTSTIDEYDDNVSVNFVKQISNIIANGLKNIPDQRVKVGKTTYVIEYQMSPTLHGLTTVIANVKWNENGKIKKTQMQFTNVGTKSGSEALANYANGLAKLNKDVWENAATEFLSLGLDGVGRLQKEKKVGEFCANLLDALTDDAMADAFASKLGGNVKEFVVNEGKGFFKNSAKKGLAELVEQTLPNGKEIVKAVNKLQELKNDLDKLEKNGKIYNSETNANEKLVAAYWSMSDVVKNMISQF